MRLVRTVVFRLVPLVAAVGAVQAGSIYDFGSTVGFTCAATENSCSGSGAGTSTLATTLPGFATLYTTPSVTETDSSGLGDIVTLQWTGTGDNLISSLFPLFWNFTITPVGTASAIGWDLKFSLGTDGTTTTYYNSGSQTGLSNSGTTSVTIPSNASSEIWTVDLLVNYSLSGSAGGVTVSVPQVSSGIELGSPAPEPATWGLAGGVLFAMMMARRKLRGR